MMFELRQVILVLGEELVRHLPDFGQREHRGGQRVVADGAIDHQWVASQGGGDRHLFDAAGKLG